MQQPKNMTPEGLSALRNFEAEGGVSADTIDLAVRYILDGVVDSVIANVDHWTDDDGLHRTPFERDLRKELPEVILSELRQALETTAFTLPA